MSFQTLNIIKAANKPKKEKYDILTFDTHERTQSQMAKTGHNFYAFRYPGCKKWDSIYAEMPKNYYVLPENSLVGGIDFDFILSQSKFGQLQVAKQLQQFLRIPIISLEHTTPTKDLSPEQLAGMKSIWGDFNVFITEFSKKEWGAPGANSFVITNATDHDFFIPENKEVDSPYILSIVNEFVQRDYCCNYYGWKRVVENLPHRLVGNTPGLSEPAKSLEDLRDEYNKCAVFFNSSTHSPIPTVVVEAMSCGKPIVSTNTCAIPDFVKHGVNGFLSNDEAELKEYLVKLLNDKDLREKMGAEARKTILENFSESVYLNKWNNVFDFTYGAKR
jgi:glycosyltransferase involved in cell wall biosynthesis